MGCLSFLSTTDSVAVQVLSCFCIASAAVRMSAGSSVVPVAGAVAGATITAAREVKPNAHNNPITAGNVPASRSRPCLLFVCLVIILKRFLVRELRSPLAISGL